MASGMEMLIKSMIGIDPEELKKVVLDTLDRIKATETEMRERTDRLLEEMRAVTDAVKRLELEVAMLTEKTGGENTYGR